MSLFLVNKSTVDTLTPSAPFNCLHKSLLVQRVCVHDRFLHFFLQCTWTRVVFTFTFPIVHCVFHFCHRAIGPLCPLVTLCRTPLTHFLSSLRPRFTWWQRMAKGRYHRSKVQTNAITSIDESLVCVYHITEPIGRHFDTHIFILAGPLPASLGAMTPHGNPNVIQRTRVLYLIYPWANLLPSSCAWHTCIHTLVSTSLLDTPVMMQVMPRWCQSVPRPIPC